MIVTLGDALVDVIVEPSRPLVADDDVPSRTTVGPGGQAANVAAWVVALGGRASLVTRLGDDASGRWLRRQLEERGVVVRTPVRPGRTGTVVSLVAADGSRTMASDRGDAGDLQAADLATAWFEQAAWLHLSGYAVFSGGWPSAAVAAAGAAQQAGAQVSVDLSSAGLLSALGAGEVAARLGAVGAVVAFGNDAEASAVGDIGVRTVVVKQGPLGAEVRADGATARLGPLPPLAGAVRDTTGAGDAFAAGWLVGGPAVALAAAARCVTTVGALPGQ